MRGHYVIICSLLLTTRKREKQHTGNSYKHNITIQTHLYNNRQQELSQAKNIAHI